MEATGAGDALADGRCPHCASLSGIHQRGCPVGAAALKGRGRR